MTADGVIRVWGTQQVGALVQRWERGLRNLHPGMSVQASLTGSDIAMARLYTGLADLALIGRESTPVEGKAFEWIYRYPPTFVEILTGSPHRPGQSPALVAFVHRDNPISRLTLVQLDALFGHERLRGAPRNLRTWGDLGLAGDWADQIVKLYTHDAESGTGRFLRRAILGDSRKMNWEALTEFDGDDAGPRILQALAADRFGLALAAGYREPVSGVRALALASAASDEFCGATRRSLITRRYPLTRLVYAYFNRPPATPVDAKIDGFLRYVLSPAGQREVAGGPDYLPLSREAAGQQLQKLERTVTAGAGGPAVWLLARR